MDENYLDELLNQMSSDEEKQNNTFEHTVESDAGIDIDMSDLDNISLEELDGLDDLDLSDLELDDIDFDDMDVTSLNTKPAEQPKETMEEDFNLDALLEELSEPVSEDEGIEEASGQQWENASAAADDVFTAADNQLAEDTNIPEVFEEPEGIGKGSSAPANGPETLGDSQSIEDMDLDDLFSALGIDGEPEDNDGESPYTAGQDALDDLFQMSDKSKELDDIADIGEVKSETKENTKQKKSLSEIFFGAPDEDDAEEEQMLKVRHAEKEIKKEKQRAAKEEKRAAKRELLEHKKKEDVRKQQKKTEKKKLKQAELEAELEAESNEKRVSTPTVIVVFALFAAFAVAVVLGAKQFDYTQVIHKASDYFERQRYRLAYDEVSGVEIKKKDEELRDRIYTVMYVERLYESYENNMELGRPDKALDALLRGLEKYDEHYAEAVELQIVEDIDLCRAKILIALADTYGISETQAYEIMELEGQNYTQTLISYSEGL